jgi:hypothetical protein
VIVLLARCPIILRLKVMNIHAISWRPGMKSLTALPFAVALLTVAAAPVVEWLPVIKGGKDAPIIAVWREGGNSPLKSSGPYLIAAMWPDGRSIWSEDKVLGGAPYYQGWVSPVVLSKTLRGFEADKAFSAPNMRRDYLGPDAIYTVIYLALPGHAFYRSSWHEISELDPTIVATSSGLAPLNGKTRDEVLAGDTQDYLNYRALWKRIREKVSSLLPRNREQTSVSFEYEYIQLDAPTGAVRQHH